MESSGPKRQKQNGVPYPYIPFTDQDYGDHETANHPFFIRTVPCLPLEEISKFDKLRAELITMTNDENEMFVRSCHPSLCSQGTVMVSESSFGEPVWLVLSPITAPEKIYAGGRAIHYYPAHHSEFIPWLLSPRSTAGYNRYFDRYINPRRFLRATDLNSLRELFPAAIGATVLIAGFLIILFDDMQHVRNAYTEIYPLELAGMLVYFDVARDELSTTPVEYGLDTDTRIGEENTRAGCIGLKVRLQDGTEAITTVTHGFVNCPGTSLATTMLNVVRQMLDKAKKTLVRYLPARIAEDNRFITYSGVLTNNPIGREVLIAASHHRIGHISRTYDQPSRIKPYPHGYDHDLSLVTDPALPDVCNPPGYPAVSEWADYSTALDGRQDVYTVSHHVQAGRWRAIEGKVDQTLFNRSVILGTGYRWSQRENTQAAVILWHTEPALTPTQGWSGAPLCVGRPNDPIAKALAFQNFQQAFKLPLKDGKPDGVLIKAGFVLPADIKNSTILSANSEATRPLFNTLPAKIRNSSEASPQRRSFSAV
ncbi:hypothetical protein N7520_004689 [Penicillium odoratum]|uniref:uncharacterized protein n=1 Tax=Penicillium odoratum TaxID=1167516 RepID=UPI0025499777|nr:uncharacterized protein N7520_004689 [Penicillium odoratum]KAJ5765130.1 hypothetical protein N7520_004689 [Penicillium odoratum]